jgi:hypothetical protein
MIWSHLNQIGQASQMDMCLNFNDYSVQDNANRTAGMLYDQKIAVVDYLKRVQQSIQKIKK